MYIKSIIAGVVISAIVILGSMSYVSAHNKGNRMERDIVATYQDNRQMLGQYGNKIAEAAQIPDMQRDDLTDVVVAALDARYGENGSQAMFQFLQEQNPNIDSAVYTQIQRMIEAGRDDFTRKQTILLDKRRIYETALGTFWGGMWLKTAGYPEIVLDDYNVVSTAAANKSFESGEDEALVLR